MGLHQRPRTGKTPSTKDIERQNLVWLLFLVDKQRIFVRGSACRFYIFECNMELPDPRSAAWSHKAIPIHLKLACILEDIYKHLYSPQANRLKSHVRRERLQRMHQQLETWSTQHRSELESKGVAGREKGVLLQLRYAWHITRLLVISRDSESSGKLRLETAREALQVIQTLCSGSFIFDGGLLVLERYAKS